nr:response regulator transcription factor [uncultured Duganella sp.]
MNIVVLTPVRLLGEGLAACCQQHPDIAVTAVVNDLATLGQILSLSVVDLVLIDVTQGVDLYDVRTIAAERRGVALVAFGLTEQRHEVVRCGRAGFTGYIAREASVDTLCKALKDIVAGRLACPAEISCGLLHALFRSGPAPDDIGPDRSLTRRESDVLQLIGCGLSNKEIARELTISLSTVKHHVHNILDKLQLQRRAQAMRRVRDAPWLVVAPDVTALRVGRASAE